MAYKLNRSDKDVIYIEKRELQSLHLQGFFTENMKHWKMQKRKAFINKCLKKWLHNRAKFTLTTKGIQATI